MEVVSQEGAAKLGGLTVESAPKASLVKCDLCSDREGGPACVEACPWHMPTVNPETGKSSKCIACGACVAGCPSGALSIVDWNAVTSAAQAAYLDL